MRSATTSSGFDGPPRRLAKTVMRSSTTFGPRARVTRKDLAKPLPMEPAGDSTLQRPTIGSPEAKLISPHFA